MTQTQLRNGVSIGLVVAHALTFLLVLGLFVLGGLTESELTTTLGMLAPMLAAISALAVQHIIDSQVAKRDQSAKLSRIFVFGVVFFTVTYLLAIVALLLLKALNRGFESFDGFKVALAAVETIFGAYTGKVLGSLFAKGRES